MRKGRLIVKDKSAVYHVITRTVNGEVWFTGQEKEVLRKQLWRTAEFCGLEVLTYVIMSNHIQVAVRDRQKETCKVMGSHCIEG